MSVLVTNPEELKKYRTDQRIWQGVPGIEVTGKGRIFSCFYSGKTGETFGNYAVVVMSEDGVTFSEPIAVAIDDAGRCYDACLWMDPLDRLWFIWSVMPNHGVYASICEDPDAEELVWGPVTLIGHDVMMNKPTVLTTGEWIFPIAVWNHGVRVLPQEYDTKQEERRSFVYQSKDHGVSFEKLGGADVPDRDYDEHMVLELSDGRLAVYVRTTYGIGVSYSADGGRTWTLGEDSGLGGPDTRFHIRRLPSGRVLLVNHVNYTGRNNLTALLSEDDGQTWKYQLLLDGRDNVSYPDAAIGADGYLYIAYDRDRGNSKKCLKEAYACAREILYAKITEEDIMAGQLVSPDSKLACIVSKLGKYAGEKENPYEE